MVYLFCVFVIPMRKCQKQILWKIRDARILLVDVFPNKLYITDKEFIFDGLRGVVSDVFIDTVWNMIYKRYKVYENL